jgi:hypothetical protein
MAKKKNEVIEEPVDAREEELSGGVWVFSMLGVLTLGEFLIANIATPWTFVLWGVAIWKTIYVVTRYMNISRLFSDEETH